MSYSEERRFLPQRSSTSGHGKIRERGGRNVRIEGGPYDFQVSGIMIEGNNEIGVDVQYPWEDSPRRFHQHRMTVSPFFIDQYPLPTHNSRNFWTPRTISERRSQFLKHWTNGTYPPDGANKPVVWVSVEDARAYASGPARGFLANGNGSMPRRRRRARLPWGSAWTQAPYLRPIPAGPWRPRRMSALIRKARAPGRAGSDWQRLADD